MRLRDRLSPEARLHLLAAMDEDGDAAFAALAAGPVDWARVVAAAQADRAHAALAARIDGLPEDALPPAVREGIRRMGMVAAFRQAALESRLADALDVLAARGIPVLLMKGAALAVGVYGSFAARPMADVDLLVPAGAAADAQRALRAAGWTAAGDGAAARDALYAGHHHLAPLADGDGGGVIVEVHAGPLPPGHPFAFGADALWRNARPAEVRGRPVQVPAPAPHLLHLALHFAWSHALRSGGWRAVRDVRAIACRAAPDWDALPGQAREAGAAAAVHWTLRLARGLVDAPVPAVVVEALRPPGPEWMLRRLEMHLAAALAGEAACPSPWLERRCWEAAVRPRVAARPWHRDEDFRAAAVPSPRAAASIASWRALPAWRRWLTTVLR